MPLNIERLQAIIRSELQEWEPTLRDYLLRELTKKPAQVNLGLARYWSPRSSQISGAWKGTATILGKFYQKVMVALANEVYGQTARLEARETDFTLGRQRSVEWFDRLCDQRKLARPPSSEATTRTYVVQLKSTPTSASGATKPAMYHKLGEVAEARYKETRAGYLDVVPIVYNVFGTMTELRSTGVRRVPSCYELSGQVGFDWLVGDPDGSQYAAFAQTLKQEPRADDIDQLLMQFLQ